MRLVGRSISLEMLQVTQVGLNIVRFLFIYFLFTPNNWFEFKNVNPVLGLTNETLTDRALCGRLSRSPSIRALNNSNIAQ